MRQNIWVILAAGKRDPSCAFGFIIGKPFPSHLVTSSMLLLLRKRRRANGCEWGAVYKFRLWSNRRAAGEFVISVYGRWQVNYKIKCESGVENEEKVGKSQLPKAMHEQRLFGAHGPGILNTRLVIEPIEEPFNRLAQATHTPIMIFL